MKPGDTRPDSSSFGPNHSKLRNELFPFPRRICVNQLLKAGTQDRRRNLLFLTTPELWQTWPFLPIMRQRPGSDQECGVLCDLLHYSGRAGFSATVFLSNFLLMPQTEPEILLLPREVYENAEQVYAAGWRIDGEC